MSRTAFRAGRDQASLSENMELLTGQRGDGSNRAVTYRDLAKLGVLTLRRGAGGKVVPEIVKPGDNDNSVSRPIRPQNVKATGGFGSILVTWDNPTYSGHAYAEVFRHTKNVLSEAALIATVNANVFGDIVPLGSKFFYWVRFVNINNTGGAHSGVVYAETSQNISDVIDEIGDQMRESDLIQELNKKNNDNKTKISEVSETVSEINKDGSIAHKSLWAKKAQAGQITAGIGIIAKSDGTSQVAVSASQFFVFDPNNPNRTITPTFAIDKGKVVIPKALIENATIQILQAQKITADYVRAGIEMSSPKINAGEMRGGDAGFGASGPYNGYNTFIYSDGTLKTNRLIVPDGYIGSLQLATGAATSVHNAETTASNRVFLNFGTPVSGKAVVTFNVFVWPSNNPAPSNYTANFRIRRSSDGLSLYSREHRFRSELTYSFTTALSFESWFSGLNVEITTNLPSTPNFGVEISTVALVSVR
ncbi:phage tail tip fiber protein [Vibrio metschnikovii]|uniref:phage tail tip fiber protein n=1 Tax=Vibrio metschnikovii TaxID=28172 RepID=UPI002FC666C0|nr:DUF1983 domain-containing protein [Vibrio metschnikovii]